MLVFNASPLIYLCSELKREDLLLKIKEIDSKLILPEKVNEELKDATTRKKINSLLEQKVLILEKSMDESRFEYLQNEYFQLGKGELSAIVLAEANNSTVVLDEKKAREVAQELNLSFIGVLGLTLKIYKEGLINISEAKEISKQMHESDAFRIDLAKLGYKWLIE